MYQMKIQKPILPKTLIQSDDIIEVLQDEDLISGYEINSITLTSDELDKTSISESLLEKVDLTQVETNRFDAVDCIFKSCNFTASRMPDSSWHRILIDSARLVGAQITNSTLRNVYIKNSKLELVNFRFSHFKNVVFEDCVMNDVDFYEGFLKNVEFNNCIINSITFANAKMINVDISKSSIEIITGVNNLRGTTINYDQLMQLAPSLANEAGIKVK